MTATLERGQQLDDVAFEAAVERLRAYQAQLDQADRHADAGSLQRAADLAAIYEDKRWMADLPEPKQSKKPGAFQTIPDSRNRFASKWVQERIGLRRSQVLHLLVAHEVVSSMSTRVDMDPEVGEYAIRPLTKLNAQGRVQEADQVWRRAVADAAGQTPSAKQVQDALREHNKALGYTPARQQEMRASTLRDTYRARVKRDFEWLVNHSSPEEVKELLRELAERVVAEKQWARGAV